MLLYVTIENTAAEGSPPPDAPEGESRPSLRARAAPAAAAADKGADGGKFI